MIKFKDLVIGDKIREINPYGYVIDSIVDKDPYEKEGNWYIWTIAPSNEFLEYREDEDGRFYNHLDVEIEMKWIFSILKGPSITPP